MTTYKYTLTIEDRQTVLMPLNSTILTVQMQYNTPCLWAMVDPDVGEQEARSIEFFGTGRPMDDNNRAYIGTIQQGGGQLIWHIFERLN